jgi:hypothetical protein
MKINKNSIHYKIASLVCSPKIVPNSLCLYFWKVVLGLVVILGGIVVVCLVLFLISTVLLQFFFEDLEVHALTGGFILVMLLGAILSDIRTKRKIEEEYLRQENMLPTTKEDNLLVAWIKAKKAKVCPQLEFYDE